MNLSSLKHTGYELPLGHRFHTHVEVKTTHWRWESHLIISSGWKATDEAVHSIFRRNGSLHLKTTCYYLFAMYLFAFTSLKSSYPRHRRSTVLRRSPVCKLLVLLFELFYSWLTFSLLTLLAVCMLWSLRMKSTSACPTDKDLHKRFPYVLLDCTALTNYHQTRLMYASEQQKITSGGTPKCREKKWRTI